jgi:tetratricopeptide (TPR) repeat protein
LWKNLRGNDLTMPVSIATTTKDENASNGGAILCVVALLLVIVLIYWPGLTGGFVFDDEANLLDNQRLALSTFNLDALRTAFWSGDAGPLGRPLSMITFALNHYFTGFDPWWFKLTNLVIHLINVVLVFWLAKTLLAAFAGKDESRFPYTGALFASALWGLHPLNMTSVLYVVQRMTSLSTLFGLLALAIFSSWRASERTYSWPRSGLTWLAIVASLVASVFSKESGLLFIPLLLWVKLMVFHGENDGQPIRLGRFTLRQVLWGLCVLGALIALAMLPSLIRPENYYHRNFTMPERAMSETRVLFFYLRLFFAPSLSALGLYHDDFVISTGLLQPPTTLVAILGLVAITVAAIVVARRWPIWLFAWGWFLISHALESTVFSLELVHEHRNYFATLGFALLIPWLVWRATPKLRRIAPLAAGVFVALCAFVTFQRAQVWADPITHAMFEAQTHPLSDRANYQLGYEYWRIWRRTKDAQFVELAKNTFQKTMNCYKAGNGAWFALLHLAYALGETPNPVLIESLRQRLRDEPLTNANPAFLTTFANCQITEGCHMTHHEAVSLFEAALANPRSNSGIRASILTELARYYAEAIGDIDKTEELLNDALRLHDEPNGRQLLAQVLRQHGKLAEAQEQLDIAKRLDSKRAFAGRIGREQQAIDEAVRETEEQR